MQQFIYSAKNSEGKTITGSVEAPTVETAAEMLRERQLIVLSIEEKSASTLGDRLRQLINRVSMKEVTFFARQLAVMIGATIPIVRSLRALTRQTANNYFRTVVASVASDVDGGTKLSQALAKYPRIFDPFFIHMVRSGETTGRLDQVLEYLATQKEKDYNLRSRVRGALIYPAFIVAVMIVIGVIMMIYVVPSLADILTQAGTHLPLTTRMLLNTSYIFRYYWWLVFLVLVVMIVLITTYLKTQQGRYALDYLKIKAPIIGPIYQRVALSRFCISLSNLLGSGVALPAALSIVGDIMDNAIYRDIVQRTIKEVEAGNSISSVFVHYTLIPVVVTQMVSVGEETGRLDEILDKLGQFYSREVENALATLTSLIEPIIIILLGVGAGFMVSAILTPIYNVTTSIA